MFKQATPGDCDVMVGLAEQADMLEEVSNANDDVIECSTNNCSDGLDDVSTMNVDSTDCGGAGSGSGSASDATIESNLTMVVRYDGGNHARGEMEQSGYCT